QQTGDELLHARSPMRCAVARREGRTPLSLITSWLRQRTVTLAKPVPASSMGRRVCEPSVCAQYIVYHHAIDTRPRRVVSHQRVGDQAILKLANRRIRVVEDCHGIPNVAGGSLLAEPPSPLS